MSGAVVQGARSSTKKLIALKLIHMGRAENQCTARALGGSGSTPRRSPDVTAMLSDISQPMCTAQATDSATEHRGFGCVPRSTSNSQSMSVYSAILRVHGV